MKQILVIYATREGQTRRIAEHAVKTLRTRQFMADPIDTAQLPAGFSLKNYHAAIVIASVHLGRHESELTDFIKRHVSELNRLPAFFFSVSLSEAGAEDPAAPPAQRGRAQANVKQMIGAFLAETGWTPAQIKPLAGALMYSKYNFAIRFVMKRIARKEGKPTDTSRDYEFTDWEDLDRTVNGFAEGLLETGGNTSEASNVFKS